MKLHSQTCDNSLAPVNINTIINNERTHMFCVIYRFKLKPGQEQTYQANWETVADYFIQHCGALGSALHRGEGHLWIAYSRWPDKATRDAAWPGDNIPNDTLPDAVQQAIQSIQAIRQENQHLTQYDDIPMEMVNDKIVN